MSTETNTQYEDFFRYTGGRWLWDEESQLRERYREFNVRELQRAAAKSVGAQACVSISKLAEGGFNKVFRLVMDNGSVVVARIPNPNAGPPFRTTASEVATMDFARTILKIPVPRVYAWDPVQDNPVEAEYILMEEASRTQLGEIWDDMEIDGKLKIVEEITAIEEKLVSLSFTRYGNIYFTGDAFPGCEKAEVVGDVPQSLRREVEGRFVIGPVVDRDFWSKERALMDIDRGPWKTPQDYLRAIANREISWISRYAVPKPSNDVSITSEAQNSPNAHITLYNKFLDVVPYLLPSKEELIRPALWHWDIHAPNLFVEGDRISSLIDWQAAWAGPLFLQARHPRLVDYNGEMILRLPKDFQHLKESDEKARIRERVERSIILYAYEKETARSNPLLNDILHVDHGRTRREMVEFAANTWDGDILPFRQCLIRIARHWDDFGTGVPCPIKFTEEELQAHHRDGEGWNERAEFWDSLEGFVHRDGWTSKEMYEQALQMFAEFREQGLESLTGDERMAFEEQTRWAIRSVDSAL